MGREQERSRMEDREGLVGPRIFFEEIVGPRICMLHVMSDTWAHGPSAIHNEKAQSMKRHVGQQAARGTPMGVCAGWFKRFFIIGSSHETSNENHFHRWLNKN